MFILNERLKCFDWCFKEKFGYGFVLKFIICIWFYKLDMIGYEKYLLLNVMVKLYRKMEILLINLGIWVWFVSMCLLCVCWICIVCVYFEGEGSGKIKNVNLKKSIWECEL